MCLRRLRGLLLVSLGPSPQALDLIAAVNGGLVRLSDPWEVTARGLALIARRGRRT